MNNFSRLRPARVLRAMHAAAALLALAAACSADGGTDPGAPGAAVASVRLTPASSELGLGSTLQLELAALDAEGNELPTSAVTWASADTNIATVSQSGLVETRKLGIVQLQAATDGKSAVSVISVVAPRVATVALSPSAPSVLVGATVQLTARLTDDAGTVLSDRLIFWQSSSDAVARVTSTGLVSGVTAGTATITATSEGKRATVQVTVTAPPTPAPTPPPTTPAPTPPPTTPAPTPTPGDTAATARVDVTPVATALTAGATQQLTATARDAAGAVRTGRSFTWTSSAPAVATVNASGLVTAVGPGSATITARTDGVSGTAAITVTAAAPATVATVVVAPAVVRLELGGAASAANATLTATPFDAAGRALTGRSCTWSGGTALSGNGKTVVTIETLTPATARIKAKSEGATSVTATCEGKAGSAVVTVVKDD